MNIFVFEQLVSRKGDTMLTWQQVRAIRGYKGRGRKPNWYKRIEELALVDNNSRKLKESCRLVGPNLSAIYYSSIRASTDKRRKEWIVFGKERSLEVGKVTKKERIRLIVEHWRPKEENSMGATVIEKCAGCVHGKFSNRSCIVKQKHESWYQVLESVQRKGEISFSRIPLTAYLGASDIINEETSIGREVMEVDVFGIEEAVIQRVIKNEKIREGLGNIVNRLRGRKVVDIYTDGSLVKENVGDREKKKMGIGWVVVDGNSSDSSISFKCRIVDWPSSTRAELGAIWTALLAVPYKTKVRIYSDSRAAIEGIQNSKGTMSIRSHFKVKNRSLIGQILDCCITKKLDLELIKVKGHSMNVWNDKADRLAKEGLSSCMVLEVQEVTTGRIGITPKWKNKTIDSPLTLFVNLTVVTAYETAWADLSNIKPVLNQRASNKSSEQIN
jgi:ribonuclease HI